MRRADSSLAQKRQNIQFCTLERFREIHEEIPTLGTLNFMGDGEPLMNPELQDIIHYASTKGIYTVVTTNATLITEKIVKQWKRDKVYRIHASIDAQTKELYESTRVGADWSTTYSNLRLLGGSGIPLCINVVLTKKNIRQMPQMVYLCKDVGAKEITFLMPICTYGDDRDVRPEVSRENERLFEATRIVCKILGIKWIFPLNLDPTFRRFNFPFIRPEISIEGDLFACCYSLGRGKVWYMGYGYEIPEGIYNMGNMFKEGFRKVWYGDAYRELRQVYKDSEVPKGTVISREELLKRTKEVMENPNGRFAHCWVCQARWGMACS
jgi:MoaA/NifB/PqqE/SkfB family radical SAM enzyme